MPVKRYEVDGNPYDVSDVKEQEFLSKFSNAVFIGVLDEEGVVVEQEIKDETQDFPTSAAADADVVQPMTASQAGFTESPSVDTPSESLDPEPKSKKLIELEQKLEKAKTFKTTMKGQIIADLNDEIEIEKNLATPEGKQIANDFNSSVDAKI